MSFINYSLKEVNCKIIYYGPGFSGKTTNIQYIYEHTKPEKRGQWIASSVEKERTLFFDFLPLAIGEFSGYQTRFHLYSIPGQTFYDMSRQFVLKGVDGIVFVVDTQKERLEASMESFDLLKKNLEEQGYDIQQMPCVFQYNKRDLSKDIRLSELETIFNPMQYPYFEAIASQGQGVMETLQAVSQSILVALKG